MSNFDDLLNSLHGTSALTDDQSGIPIEIDPIQRSFLIKDTHNLVLGFEGDVNSQKVTFQLPKFHEGHDLTLCGQKTLRWKNLATGVEDWSELVVVEESSDKWIATWIVPPAVYTAAGIIQIAISIYDLNGTHVAFAWNTATFSGFVVEKTLSEVGRGPRIPSVIAPAKNEILQINEETHSIVAPQGYNFIISSYGNKNTVNVYFQTTPTVGGIDLLDENTRISVVVSVNGEYDKFTILSSDISASFPTTGEGQGLVNFTWRVPEVVTKNHLYYTGIFSIVVVFEALNDNKEVEEVWSTTTFNKLSLAQSLLLQYNSDDVLPTEFNNVIDANTYSKELDDRKISGIVLFKHGSDEYWDSSDYVPAEGEKVYYDAIIADGKTIGTKVKIGNGIDIVKDLPFQIDPTVSDWARAETRPDGVYVVEADEIFDPKNIGEDVQLIFDVKADYKLSALKFVAKPEEVVEEGYLYLIPSDDETYYQPYVCNEGPIPIGGVSSFGKLYRHNVRFRYYHNGGGISERDGAMEVFFTIINQDGKSYSYNHQWDSTTDCPTATHSILSATNAAQLKRLFYAVQGGIELKQKMKEASGIMCIYKSTNDSHYPAICHAVVAKYYKFDGDKNEKRLLAFRGTSPSITTPTTSPDWFLNKEVIQISCGWATNAGQSNEGEYGGANYLEGYCGQPTICEDFVEEISITSI